MKYTAQQIRNWKAYEEVRAGGEYNMFDPRARQLSGLDKDAYLFCMQNYEALQKVATKKKVVIKPVGKIQRMAMEVAEKLEELEDAVSELPNYGGECRCDRETGSVKIPQENGEIHAYCLDCGGYVEV